MGFAEAIKTCFSKYVDFSGRARRSEYWYWVLFYVLVDIAASILDSAMGDGRLISTLAGLALLLPSLAVGARRLHDTGRSAWWLLLLIAVVVGWIVLIIFYCQDSQAGDNAYGPSPKGGMAPPAGYTAPEGYGPPPTV